MRMRQLNTTTDNRLACSDTEAAVKQAIGQRDRQRDGLSHFKYMIVHFSSVSR